MVYDGDRSVSDGNYEVRDEHTFHTQRAGGSSYVFTITSDSHELMNASHQQAMQNVLSDQPDFHLDLGDTFYVDGTTSQSAVDADYLDYRDPLYMGRIGPSVPIFLASGNHENEEGWNFDDTPFSIALGSVQARKAYFPTPINDGFYSGNTDPLADIDESVYGDEFRENYYAWEWGDALFVVINEYHYTMDLPYSPTAGEGNEPVTGDQWSWTLGAQQFNWFKQTIQNSSAKYKFVFSHHMLGGIPGTSSMTGGGYVRGGAGGAPFFEWGGQDGDGDWEFTAMRDEAEFGTMPVHQIMAGNGVSAYFHGHDHQYVYEVLDGVVYQEVPTPSMTGSGFSGIYDEVDPFTIEMQPNAGHLRIAVTPTEASVAYVRSNQTGVTYTYEIEPNDASTAGYTIAATAGANGSITTGGMTTYGTVTVSTGDDQTFTITPDSGYQVANVLVDGVSVGVVSSYEFTNIQADHTIEVSFAQDGPDSTPPRDYPPR